MGTKSVLVEKNLIYIELNHKYEKSEGTQNFLALQQLKFLESGLNQDSILNRPKK